MILKRKTKQSELHLARLNFAFSKINPYYPLNKQYFLLKSYKDLAYLDRFTTCFSRLQDYIVEKLFPVVLDIFGNIHDALSYIEIKKFNAQKIYNRKIQFWIWLQDQLDRHKIDIVTKDPKKELLAYKVVLQESVQPI